MSIRNLLAESRRSGPALVVRDRPDGYREIVEVRPARSPYHAKRLTPEERLAILTQTGAWPDDFPADAWCGVQAQDGGPPSSGPPQLRIAHDGHVIPGAYLTGPTDSD